MKAAVYSRILEEEQEKDVQNLFNELARQHIEPIVWQHFDQRFGRIRLPEGTTPFPAQIQLSDEIEFIVSLGGDGTLLDTIALVRDKISPSWESISDAWVSRQYRPAMNWNRPFAPLHSVLYH